ncbi:phage portal protein [Alicyclobacillus sp. ALC3]|uniref:phage portal protein n=1 Tax=Alicyclobacillus sp. ALC3 TaxID=2796143 RepID=UPI002378EB2C|nr:phage portal protein [Alicyclobacillus sp. ALC3]WDL98134.1 phage portal protein [Alicyclobacillus sp. ALC3]
MGWISTVKSMFAKDRAQQHPLSYVDVLNGMVPIFRMFGRDIYHSDLVQMCIDRIATEISKLEPKHIRESDKSWTVVNSPLNALLQFGPNDLMDTGAFLEKVTWLLYLNYNAYIYPTRDDQGNVTGLYPLNPTMVEWMQDAAGVMFIRFTFRSGEQFVIPYSNIIHLRKKFSINEVMGGDLNGQPFNEAILTTLKTDDVIVEGIEHAVQAGLAIQFILQLNTMLNDEAQKEERNRFEKALREGKSAVMATDLKGTVTPVQKSPQIVDPNVLQAVQQRILNYYGVPLPILEGNYTDAQFEAFYSNTIQPLVMSLTRNFTRVLLSPMEISHGNRISFYQQGLQYLSTAAKIQLISTAGDQGLLTDNQKLAILGYPPIPDGDRVTQSLNYIDRTVITKYQLGKAQVQKQLQAEESGS